MGAPDPAKAPRSTAFGMIVILLLGTPRADVVPEALTNRRHRIDAAQSVGFQKSCRSIARTICAVGAAAPRGVFPERAHFINHRQPTPATGADRRQRVEGGRVSVKDFGLYFSDDGVEAPVEIADDFRLAKPWQLRCKTSRHRRTQKFPPADPFARGPRRIMLAARQQHGLPPQRPLLIDDAERAKHIAALQRQRMVEYVQNSHHSHRLLLMITPHHAGIK